MPANLFEPKCEVGVSPTSGPARLSGSGYEYFMQRHGIASNSCPQALQIPLHLEVRGEKCSGAVTLSFRLSDAMFK